MLVAHQQDARPFTPAALAGHADHGDVSPITMQHSADGHTGLGGNEVHEEHPQLLAVPGTMQVLKKFPAKRFSLNAPDFFIVKTIGGTWRLLTVSQDQSVPPGSGTTHIVFDQ